MAVTINGNNTPTAGGVVYGDGSTYASTTAGSAGSVLYSAGASAPAFTAVGTSGYLLQSNGAAAPSWVVAPSGASAATPTALGTVYGKTDTAGLAFFGYNAGVANTSGLQNTVVGVGALATNSAGSENVAIGQATLASATGDSNVGIGRLAGFNITTGTFNTLVGKSAMQGSSACTGSYNSAFGSSALFAITSGTYNLGCGSLSGSAITTGGNNSIIGGYTGNQDGLDIRTLSNYAVISDGAGNRQITMKEGQTLALDSAVPNAGTGITFPATQSASTNANTLDDYEEGSWTPNVGGTATYTAQDGTYVKIGRLVYATCDLQINVLGTGSNFQISGLPFTNGAVPTATPGSVSYWATLAMAVSALYFRCDAGQAYLQSAVTTGNQTTATANAAVFGNGARVAVSITYYASA